MSDIVLRVEDLHTRFQMGRESREVIRGVSFSLQRRHTLGIVGESGCGKSVTVHSVLGLLPPQGRVISGKAEYIHADGRASELTSLERYGKRIRAIRGKEIGMIFQDPMASLNPLYTVGAQIIENLREHERISKADALARAVDMLDRLGIPDAASRIQGYPHQFSGGMKQRVMIAIAMICNPQVLIADEPTTALDVTIQAQIMELMRELQDENGTSIILITHNMGLVAEMAHEIAVMYMGRIVEQGTAHQIFENPLHPYTSALLKSVPVLGPTRKHRLFNIEGGTPNIEDLPQGCAFASRCDRATDQCAMAEIAPAYPEDGHMVCCVLYEGVRSDA